MLRLRSPVNPEDNFFAGLHDDIQREIFNYLDFSDLVSVSHTCANFRTRVKTIVSNRISSALHPFFGSSTESVLTMLQFGAGCIAGPLVTAIFNSALPVRAFPRQIQCFVTRSGRRVLFACIRDAMGLGQPEIVSLEEPFREIAFSAYRWSLPVSGQILHDHVLTEAPAWSILDRHC